MANNLRIGGLASGIDTQGTIDKILKYSKAPVDRLKQNQQTLIWKQDAYRTQITALAKLKDKLFNLKLQSSYSTKVTSSSNSQVATATAKSNAANTNYSLNVNRLATVATNSSSAPVSIRSSVTGNYLDEVTIDGNNNTFSVILDGVRKDITLSNNPAGVYKTYKHDGTAAAGNRLEDLAAAIQTQLDTAGFATPVYVKATSDHELVYYSSQKPDGSPHTLVVKSALTKTGNVTGTIAPNVIQLDAADANLSAINDYYNGMTIKMVDGAGVGQTARITAYDSVTKQITLDRDWATAPIGGKYSIITDQVTGNVSATLGDNTKIALAADASSIADYYKNMTVTVTNSGTGASETRKIIAYDNVAKIATVEGSGFTSVTPELNFGYTINVGTSGKVPAIGSGNDKIVLSSDASTVNDFYKGMKITITDGTGKNQTKTITGYDALTREATVDSVWATNPSTDSGYLINTDAMLGNTGFRNQASTKELVGNIISAAASSITLSASNQNFKITVGNNTTQNITLAAQTYANYDDFAAEIEKKIRLKGGDYDKIRVSVTNYNQLRITSVDTTQSNNDSPQSIKLENGTSADALWMMGFSNGVVSDYPKNTISLDATIWSQKDKFINAGFFDGKTESSSFSFAINGQAFTFNMTSTMEKIMNDINSNNAAGVSVYYDQFNDSLSLITKKTGNNNETGAEIQFNDPNNFLTQLFKINQANETGGENAQLSINGLVTEKKDNSFTMNEVTFNLSGAGATTVSVKTDTTGVKDKIKDFVDSYNQLIEGMNTELNEPKAKTNRYTYYKPLTDEQKETMTEEQVKAWDNKAQEGILQNDLLLEGALREMRLNLARKVDTPCTLKSTALSGTIDLSLGNRIQVTLGSQTREIVLDPKTYTQTGNNFSQYDVLADDIQKKLNLSFGNSTIKVSQTRGVFSFTSQNISIKLSNGSQNNGINILGLSDGMTVSAGYSLLSDIGITPSGDYSENGKLYLNEEKLNAALEANSEGVVRLLTNFEEIEVLDTDTELEKTQKAQTTNARKGIFYKLYEVFNDHTTKLKNKAGTIGSISTSNALGRELIDVSKRIDEYQDRLTQEEDRLWKMFSNMESMINEYNNQSSWLTSLFGQLGSNSG